MRRLIALLAAGVLAVGLSGAVAANGDGHRNTFKGTLSGYQEVPAISTTGTGKITVKVNSAPASLTYELTFSGLQGGGAGAAHLHIGQAGVSGAVVAFLCGGGTKGACPAAGGTISGTIVASDILAVPAQGIAAGDLAAVVRAMRNGVIYANVHTATFGSGEIRGQLGSNGKGNDGGDHGND
jgi:hypothetical protein